jgi:hypothetical protein
MFATLDGVLSFYNGARSFRTGTQREREPERPGSVRSRSSSVAAAAATS